MSANRLKLQNIFLKGYKSISSEGQNIPIDDITIFLGANGAGKSNLVSFFQMLNFITTGAIQKYIGQSGTSDSLLYFGPKKTSQLAAEITFSDNQSISTYKFVLSHAAGDTLIFDEETVAWQKSDSSVPNQITFDPGLKESGLFEYCKNNDTKTVQIVFNLLKNCQVFQFHDTSKEAKIRNSGYIEDANFLRSNGGNLAAFLYSIKNQANGERYYQRIIRYIKMAMPQFDDFVLIPSTHNKNYLMLNWVEADADYLFGPHQISDGSLRFMALTTLLLQPPKTLPSVIILDEPELGLHPSAISLLSGMVKTASQNCQVILATQSTSLIDEFEADNIVIVERNEEEKSSFFTKLDSHKLEDWIVKLENL